MRNMHENRNRRSAVVTGSAWTVAVLALLLSSVAAVACGETLTGSQIMQRVDERYDGDSSRSLTTLTLVSRRGTARVRKILQYTKDYGETEKTVMIFLQPADVEGVGYLSYSYDQSGRDDDTWLFLPALKRVRRISGSSRNDYFMGTDFTYDDMGDREVEEDSHTLLREETVDGKPCWVVESVPLDRTYMYSRKVAWIRQDIDMAVEVEYYDRQGRLLKELEISDIEQIDGIWTARTMTMNNVQDNHRTVLEIGEIEYNLPVNDTYFQVAALERGRIR
jgi:hypothetical protein